MPAYASLFKNAALHHLAYGEQREAWIVDQDRSPYCCDAVSMAASECDDSVYRRGFPADKMVGMMLEAGMPSCGFGVFNHVPEGDRQGTRFIFLMLMSESSKGIRV